MDSSYLSDGRRPIPRKAYPRDIFLVSASIVIQIVLAYLFGHAYDIRIFMATGYLVGTGQDPYIAQNLTQVFHNSTFQGLTTIGYPPPWSLILGLIYSVTYKIFPNFLVYNLVIKIPIIAANICLSYLVAGILSKLDIEEKVVHRAWIFLLFNPFLLYASSAWGQFDTIVALFSLLALVLLSQGNFAGSALLLSLAISFKPIALPLVFVVWVYMRGKPFNLIFRYMAICFLSVFLLFVGPFFLFHWDPSPILQHWNAHFSVGGGLSYMSFLELVRNSYQLPDLWWLVGLLWFPALAIAAYFIKPPETGLVSLVKLSTALIMIFFLFRTWVSEPNILLILPLILILTSVRELDPWTLTAVWVIPLFFSIFNTSTFQLLFPSMPGLMDRLIHASDSINAARLVMRTIVVIPWLIAGSWIVRECIKDNHSIPNKRD
jgi:hypothetical protein